MPGTFALSLMLAQNSSGSVTRTFAPQSSIERVSSSALSMKLKGTVMAPRRAAAVKNRPSSGTLVRTVAIRSPLRTPSLSRSAAATALADFSASLNVSVSPEWPSPRLR